MFPSANHPRQFTPANVTGSFKRRPCACGSRSVRIAPALCSAVWLKTASGLCATTTNSLSAQLGGPGLPDTGPSLLRVVGALALVLGLFLGGAWLVRNGRFSNFRRSSRLNVLETRSLGARQAIYVVAYGSERFLIGSTPAGINLLSHLTSSSEAETDCSAQPASTLSFGQALTQVLRGSKTVPGKGSSNA